VQKQPHSADVLHRRIENLIFKARTQGIEARIVPLRRKLHRFRCGAPADGAAPPHFAPDTIRCRSSSSFKLRQILNGSEYCPNRPFQSIVYKKFERNDGPSWNCSTHRLFTKRPRLIQENVEHHMHLRAVVSFGRLIWGFSFALVSASDETAPSETRRFLSALRDEQNVRGSRPF
jgi:hypothetical protein